MKISTKRRAANRANAQRSTGPRSDAGKRKASGNAYRHGLSIPIHFEGEMPARYEAIAAALAAGRAERAAEARVAAELRFNLDRIRAATQDMLNERIAQLVPSADPTSIDVAEAQAVAELAPSFGVLEGYARRLRSKLYKVQRALAVG